MVTIKILENDLVVQMQGMDETYNELVVEVEYPKVAVQSLVKAISLQVNAVT